MDSHRFSSISRHTPQRSNRVSQTLANLSIATKIYPKQLPQLIYGPVVDEVGFTASERAALRQAWNIISPKQSRFGQNIFYKFLTEHYYAAYKYQSGGDLYLHALHSHALRFVHFVGDLINEPDPVVFQLMLHDNNQTHKCHYVPNHLIEMLVQALADYILDALCKVASPTLENALKCLVEKFANFLRDTECNTKSSVFYKSQLKRNKNPTKSRKVPK